MKGGKDQSRGEGRKRKKKKGKVSEKKESERGPQQKPSLQLTGGLFSERPRGGNRLNGRERIIMVRERRPYIENNGKKKKKKTNLQEGGKKVKEMKGVKWAI